MTHEEGGGAEQPRLGDDGDGCRGVRQLDLEPGPSGDARGLADLDAVEAHPAVGGDVGRLRAREPEQARQRGIDALSLEPVGDRQAAQLSHG